MKTIKTAALLICTLLLASCQNLQGERQGDYYFSPAGAYILDMSINTFRGEVVLDERCDRQGGSTTFWDGSGRGRLAQRGGTSETIGGGSKQSEKQIKGKTR